MKVPKRYKTFEQIYQVVSWLGTLSLFAIVFISNTIAPSHKPVALLIASLAGISSLFFVHLMPLKGEGYVKYELEDKVLVESLTMILLLTAFLYFAPFSSSGFFLLLIPILIEATVLHEKIIFAEALFSFVAIIFLQIANTGSVEIFPETFMIELGIFLAIVALMYILTRELRKAGERNEELSNHLSERLDQIQVISTLVQQSENFMHFNLLLERIGEITSDAFDSEQCGFFFADGNGNLELHDASVGFEEHDKAIYRLESNMKTPLSVFQEGRLIIVNDEEDAKKEGVSNLVGDRHLKNYMLTPLGMNDRRIGVIMISNRRGASFDSKDVHFLQLLAGFIYTLIDSAKAFSRLEDERLSAKKLTKLLVGRELKMKELKNRLAERGL